MGRCRPVENPAAPVRLRAAAKWQNFPRPSPAYFCGKWVRPVFRLLRMRRCLAAAPNRYKSAAIPCIPTRAGRGRGTRTHDPRFWRPMLYQLSYTPMGRPHRECARLAGEGGFGKGVLRSLSRFAGEGETPQAARVRVCGGSGGQVTHPHPGAARLSLSRKAGEGGYAPLPGSAVRSGDDSRQRLRWGKANKDAAGVGVLSLTVSTG